MAEREEALEAEALATLALDSRELLSERLKEELEELGVSFAFPTQTIHFGEKRGLNSEIVDLKEKQQGFENKFNKEEK